MATLLATEPEFFGPVDHDFSIERPASLEGALFLASEADVDVVGFGSTWQRWLRRRMVIPRRAVFLDRVPELRGVAVDDGHLVLGAMCTLSELITSDQVTTHAPMLAAVARTIAGPAVRNWASVGGNVALRYDLGAPLIAMGATVDVSAGQVTRRLAVGAAMADPAFPAAGAVITKIRIPMESGTRWGYQRFMPRKAHAYSLLAAAVAIQVDAEGAVSGARVAVGTPEVITPISIETAARSLVGRRPTAADLTAAGDLAAAAIDPPDDGKAAPWYRQQLARVGVRRALEQALSQAHTEQGASDV